MIVDNIREVYCNGIGECVLEVIPRNKTTSVKVVKAFFSGSTYYYPRPYRTVIWTPLQGRCRIEVEEGAKGNSIHCVTLGEVGI